MYIVELRISGRRVRFVGNDLTDVAHREKAKIFTSRDHAYQVAAVFRPKFRSVVVDHKKKLKNGG